MTSHMAKVIRPCETIRHGGVPGWVRGSVARREVADQTGYKDVTVAEKSVAMSHLLIH